MIPIETRAKAVVHYSHFLRSYRRVARLYGVSKSSLQRWVSLRCAALHPKRHPRQSRALLPQVHRVIRDALAQNPFTTPQALCQVVSSQCHLRRSRATLARWVHKAGFTRKKAFRCVRADHPPERVLEFCSRYLATQDPQLVSIDEAGFYLDDHPRFGYAPRGRRLNVAAQRTLRRAKLTLLMAVTPQGILSYKILQHNCKKPDFVQFLRQLPAPPGRTLILDNIAFHHSKEVADCARERGWALLYSLPYSPRCNTIELVFAMLKARYRAACPAEPNAGFSYQGALEGVLNDHTRRDFAATFAHTRAWVQQVAHAPGAFSGYDS